MSILHNEFGNMNNEWRILQNQWGNACQNWNDSVRQRFEREFWQEYQSLMTAYLRKFQETSDVIEKAYRHLNL